MIPTNQKPPANENVASTRLVSIALLGSVFNFMITEYQPELWTVQKDDIYAAIHALDAGLEHTRSLLGDHDVALGRTTRKNKMWAEQLERDVENMERTLTRLRKYGPHTVPSA
jgi:hypothetical protein